MPLVTRSTSPQPKTSRRNQQNPTGEKSREETTGLAEPTSLSIDRTSSSVRDYGVEGGGESPALLHCGPTTTSGIRILEDIQIVPPRTTMDPYQTPAQPKVERVPRTVVMPSESPAGPDDDEYQTPRPPTREVTTATETARPAGSAREAASRDASRERATARAASRDASRERATVRAASRDASRERATVRAADVSEPRGRAADAPLGAVAPTRAPLGSAAVVCAPRGGAGAVIASRDRTSMPAPRVSGGRAGPQNPLAPHLAARKGITAPTIATAAKQKAVAKQTTPTPPGAPQNTPATPATTMPARNMPISRSQTDMQPPKQSIHQRPRSRQSEYSGKSDRSADTTPERCGSRTSLGPPLTEPRALVSTPTPGYGPSAPAPFVNTAAITETPRSQKRAREEGDSEKMKPAVRPKIYLSPASQDSEEMMPVEITPLPSTSYADQLRSTHIAENKNKKNQDTAEQDGRGQNTKRTAPTEEAQQQQRAPATTTTTTSKVAEAEPKPVKEAPPQKQRPKKKTAARTEPATAIPTADTQESNDAELTQTNEPVVAALNQGTKAKPVSESTALETTCDVLIGVLQEIILDLQRGASITSIISASPALGSSLHLASPIPGSSHQDQDRDTHGGQPALREGYLDKGANNIQNR
ncbi:hypothetical protein ACJJTC_007094 [Scirpophaga incertulas]